MKTISLMIHFKYFLFIIFVMACLAARSEEPTLKSETLPQQTATEQSSTPQSLTATMPPAPEKRRATLGDFRISLGADALVAKGLTLEVGTKLFSYESSSGTERGLYLLGSIQHWSSSYDNHNDSSTSYDYKSTYTRDAYQLMLQYESYFSPARFFGFDVGTGYRWEKGQIKREYSRQESIPVFFGTQSRTVDQSTETSDTFNKGALAMKAGVFLDVTTSSKTFSQMRFGWHILAPLYADSDYKIRLPDGSTQTRSLYDGQNQTGLFYSSFDVIF